MLILVIGLVLLGGFGGGYVGNRQWGSNGGFGVGIGTILIILLILFLLHII